MGKRFTEVTFEHRLKSRDRPTKTGSPCLWTQCGVPQYKDVWDNGRTG